MKTVAGAEVDIARPQNPNALTFILTGANLDIENYRSIKECLLKLGHVVVSFYINVLMPPIKNHRKKANQVKEIFLVLNNEFKFDYYNIIGHSVGGKIALMVASLHNTDNKLGRVLALDPVDQSPVEFTKKSGNLSLNNIGDVKITMTCTGNCSFLSDDHNANAILKKQRSTDQVKVVNHKGASHMAYCDEVEVGVFSWKKCLDEGNGFKNKAVKEETLNTISEKFNSCLLTSAFTKVQNANFKVADKVGGTVTKSLGDIGSFFR